MCDNVSKKYKIEFVLSFITIDFDKIKLYDSMLKYIDL